MFEQQQIEQGCFLCKSISDSNDQIQMKLVEILQDLRTILLNNQQLEKINYISNDNGFCLLMKCVVWEVFSNEGTMNCSHTALIQQFLKALKCSQEQLMKACQMEFSKISKRKYELDLIKSALKHIPEKIIQIKQNKTKQRDSSKIQQQKTQPKISFNPSQKNNRNNQSLSNSQQEQQISQNDANRKSSSKSQSQRRKQMEIYYQQNHGFTYFYYPKKQDKNSK